MTALGERRFRERRAGGPALRFPERRTGFDRRSADGWLAWYRDRPQVVVAILAMIIVLNIADFGLTLRAIDLGAREANPVMSQLFDRGPAYAGAVKLLVALLVTGVMWQLRRYRQILAASLMAAGGFGLLVTYQLLLVLSAA